MISRLLVKTKGENASIPWLVKGRGRGLSPDNKRNASGSGMTNNLKKKDELPSWIDTCKEFKKEQVERLHNEFPLIIEDIENLSIAQELPLSQKRIQDMVRHLVPNSPNMAAQVIVVGDFYAKTLPQKQPFDEEQHTKLLYKLAWIVEMMGREVNLFEDLQDSAEVRYNEKCWHRIDDAGLKCIADGMGIYYCGTLLLEEHFREKSYYIPLLELINNMFFLSLSSEMELSWLNPQSVVQSKLSFDEFVAAKNKSNASVFFILPNLAAMIMNDVRDPTILEEATSILYQLSHFGGLVLDYSDCFADDVRVNQRKCKDIQEGKLTWPLVQALQLGSEAQCRRLKELYGKKDDESEQTVKGIYKDLGVREKLEDVTREVALKLEANVRQLDSQKYPRNFWLSLMGQFNTLFQGKCTRL